MHDFAEGAEFVVPALIDDGLLAKAGHAKNEDRLPRRGRTGATKVKAREATAG